MRVISRASAASAALALAALVAGCGIWSSDKPTTRVVVYSALDREFSEPILKGYGFQKKIDVSTKFDVESTKTVGLTEDIIREDPYTRCDLFWNNEILNTLRLKQKGLLVPFKPKNAKSFPAQFKAADGTWYGFAAR